MGKVVLIVAAIIFTSIYLSAQTNTFPKTDAVGIGTLTSNASSLLDIVIDSKGVLIPRITKKQRNSIARPATVLLIYQTNSTSGFYFYNGTVSIDVSPTRANTRIHVTSLIYDFGYSTMPWASIYSNGVMYNGSNGSPIINSDNVGLDINTFTGNTTEYFNPAAG